MSAKKHKRQREELLGMSMTAAEKKLRKAVIHELARQLGKNVCLECGRAIDEPENLAIKHVKRWEDQPDQFFDLTNIAFGHASCVGVRTSERNEHQEATAEGRRQAGMKKIEVIVETPEGTPLRGCVHQGQVYVGGKRDQRYQIRVRNLTGRRLLVVVTVDGRNVNTGKPGDWSDSGHILTPHADWVFTGWRQSNETVAAFRLGSKSDSYSAQMGTAENVGVIGVAVFEEKTPEPPIITVREKEYVPFPVYPGGTWPAWPSRPWSPGPWYSVSSGDGQVFGSSVNVTSSSTSTLQHTPRSKTPRRLKHTGRKQELGTEFGETLASHIRHGVFERATAEPCEVLSIRYDSIKALVRAGILGRRPSERKKPEPQAFPVSSGFCEPPPNRRFK